MATTPFRLVLPNFGHQNQPRNCTNTLQFIARFLHHYGNLLKQCTHVVVSTNDTATPQHDVVDMSPGTSALERIAKQIVTYTQLAPRKNRLELTVRVWPPKGMEWKTIAFPPESTDPTE